MTHVIVSGLPDIPKMNKLVFTFKGVLQKEGIQKFWIKEVQRMHNSYLNYARVEFFSMDEANLAVGCLDGFNYHAGEQYYLTAYVEKSGGRRASPRRRVPDRRSPEYIDNWSEVKQDYRNRKRTRSGSPFALESTQLDLEIELLKKKRMIIEEERRLLLESKKLELVQAYGPSAMRDGFGSDRDQRRRPYKPAEPYRTLRPRSRSPRSRRLSPRPRSTPMSSRPLPRLQSDFPEPRIPQFYAPCLVIIKEMHDKLSEHAEPKEMDNLRSLLRGTLRKRLAVVLDKKPILPLPEVVLCYREKYPASTDDELVKRLVNNLRACHLPQKNKKAAKMSKSKTEQGIKSDGNPKSQDDDTNSAIIKTAQTSENGTLPKPDMNAGKCQSEVDSGKGQELEKKSGETLKEHSNIKNAISSEVEAPMEGESLAAADGWASGGEDWTVLNSEESQDS